MVGRGDEIEIEVEIEIESLSCTLSKGMFERETGAEEVLNKALRSKMEDKDETLEPLA